MNETLGKICGLALLALCLLLILKGQKAEFAPLLRIAVLVAVGAFLFSRIMPLIDAIRELTDADFGEISPTVLFKGLGLSLLCELCAGICRESGEGGLAKGVEFAGRIELLLLALPMLEKIFSLAKSLLEMSG